VTLSVTGATKHQWVANTADVRALQRPLSRVGGGAVAQTTRLSSCEYSGTSFTVNLSFTDGKVHQVALYCCDWDTTSRVHTISVQDAATSAVLASTSLSGFNGGRWVVFLVSGSVKIVFTKVSGNNAVLQGLFLDPSPVLSGSLSHLFVLFRSIRKEFPNQSQT
jgi:hypothetical protein